MDYLKTVAKYHTVSKIELPEYDKFKVGPMTVQAQSYVLTCLGRMSLMHGTALLGLVNMDTLVINPFEKDMPLFSLDRVTVAAKETLLLEMFETRIAPVPLERCFADLIARYRLLADGKTDQRWYDNIRLPQSMHKVGNKKDSALFDSLADEYLTRFLCLCKEAKACDVQAKTAQAKKYTDGLLSNGGTCTDFFVKKKSKQFTERFFRECMFGI